MALYTVDFWQNQWKSLSANNSIQNPNQLGHVLLNLLTTICENPSTDPSLRQSLDYVRAQFEKIEYPTISDLYDALHDVTSKLPDTHSDLNALLVACEIESGISFRFPWDKNIHDHPKHLVADSTEFLIKVEASGRSIDRSGCCYGLSCMGMQAFLANELPKFFNRLALIDHLTPQNVYDLLRKEKLSSDDISNLPEIVKNRVNAEGEVDPLLKTDLNAFFDGIYLHHQPMDAPFLFTRPHTFNQEVEKTLPLLRPTQLDNAPLRPENVAQFTGAYSHAELVQYLDSLSKSFTGIPVSLILNSARHSININWDPKTEQWLLLDYNPRPIVYSNTDQFAQALHKAMNGKEHTIFFTEIYTNSQYKQYAQQRFQDLKLAATDWHDIHTVTEEKARSLDHRSASWLFVAAANGDSDTVKKLFDHNSSFDTPKELGASVLYIAAQNGHLTCVEEILKYKHNINETNRSSQTPAFAASMRGHTKVLEALIDANADIHLSKSDSGACPMFAAAEFGHVDVINLLYKNGAQADPKLNDGYSALCAAVRGGHDSAVERLIELGANVNYVSLTGATPLIQAAHVGNLDMIKLLIKHGAELDLRNHRGDNAFMIASEMGQLHVVQFLIKNYDVDINATGQDEVCALSLAAYTNRKEVVKFLLENGAMYHSDQNYNASARNLIERVQKEMEFSKKAETNAQFFKAPPISEQSPNKATKTEQDTHVIKKK